jgi:hypothetical protein
MVASPPSVAPLLELDAHEEEHGDASHESDEDDPLERRQAAPRMTTSLRTSFRKCPVLSGAASKQPRTM